MGRFDRGVTLLTALLLAGLGCLPLANWLSAGVTVPWYRVVATGFLSGTAIALGSGLIFGIISRSVPALWRTGGLDVLRRMADSHWHRATIFLSLAALGVYAWISRTVYSARPLHLDELVQLFQARLYASGRLWSPLPTHPEFFSTLHLVMQDGKVYSQFPAGGPGALALGTLVGTEWLVGPVLGASSVLLFGAVARRMERRPFVALVATAIFAFAPFTAFMAGSYMNHVSALTALLLGVWGLARIATDQRDGLGDGLLCGLGLGLAATIRPVDAFAFALPAAIWLLAIVIRRRRPLVLLGAGLGVAIPMAVLFWVNDATTGHPLRFGYTVLWGSGHGLGFHTTPWGAAHTPARGLSLVNLYFLRLQTYLFEIAIPSLFPATLALFLTARLRPLDRYLLAASAMLVGLYFAYWHDGFYPGPRFMYPLLPLLALWSARALPAIRERWGEGVGLRAGVAALVVAVGLGISSSLPVRLGQYRSGMQSARWDADAAASAAGVRSALVFVRESWGAELVARMWALGLTRPQTEQIYGAIDACRLDSAVTTLENAGVRRDQAAAMLRPLMSDSLRLITPADITGDPTLRLTSGMAYSTQCSRRIRDNQQGFTVYPPLILARGGGNTYARDLGARDSLLLADFPDRPLYLLRPAMGDAHFIPRFQRLSRDSLLAAWRLEGGRRTSKAVKASQQG